MRKVILELLSEREQLGTLLHPRVLEMHFSRKNRAFFFQTHFKGLQNSYWGRTVGNVAWLKVLLYFRHMYTAIKGSQNVVKILNSGSFGREM